MKLYLCYAMRDLRLMSVLECGEKGAKGKEVSDRRG